MNKDENFTANRIVLAVLVTFLTIALFSLSEKYLNPIDSYFYNPKVYLGVLFIPAFVVDRIYTYFYKRK